MTDFLKVVFVPGIVPGKWFARFDQRHRFVKIASASADDPLPFVESAQADVAFIRLDARGRESVDLDRFHLVELYDEAPGVAVPKDHPMAVFDEVTMDDVADEMVLWKPEPPNFAVDVREVRTHLDVVAANVGVVVAPRPLLRHFNVRGVADCGVSDGLPTKLALVWLKDNDGPVIQDFVGVCKGRTSRTSR